MFTISYTECNFSPAKKGFTSWIIDTRASKHMTSAIIFVVDLYNAKATMRKYKGLKIAIAFGEKTGKNKPTSVSKKRGTMYIVDTVLILAIPLKKKNDVATAVNEKRINTRSGRCGKVRRVTLPTPPIAGDTRVEGKLIMAFGQ